MTKKSCRSFGTCRNDGWNYYPYVRPLRGGVSAGALFALKTPCESETAATLSRFAEGHAAFLWDVVER
jgi:hypothetical protein